MRSKHIVQTLLGAIAMMALFIGLCTRPAVADGPYASGGTGGTFDTDYYAGGIPFYDQNAAIKYYPTLQPFCTQAFQYILSQHGDATQNWCGEPSFPDNQLAYHVPDAGDWAVHVASHGILTCHTGQSVKWNGDSAAPQCVDADPNDCAGKAQQHVSITQTCGTSWCPVGQKMVKADDTHWHCDGGGQWSGSLAPGGNPGIINTGGCEAVFNHNIKTQALISALGSQSAPTLCVSDYIYDGNAASDANPSPNPAACSGLQCADVTPDNGQPCPHGTSHGTGPLGEACYGVPDGGANSGDGGTNPDGTANSGTNPDGTANSGTNPDGTANSGTNPDGTTNSGGGGGAHGTANSGSNSGCVDCTAGTADDCKNPPSCDGDAIQCAILIQSWKNTCYMTKKPDSDQAGVADEMVASGGRDYKKANEDWSAGVTGILDDFFNTADGNKFAGACPNDIEIPYVNGQAIVITISRWCPAMYIIRIMLIAFAYLTAARIMFVAAL